MSTSPIPSPVSEAENKAITAPSVRSARFSWLCPALAWGSQIILTLFLRGIAGLGLLWVVAMLAQIALIAAGLYFGVKVLSLGRSSVAGADWRAAIVGVALSGGTILLILGLIAFSS